MDESKRKQLDSIGEIADRACDAAVRVANDLTRRDPRYPAGVELLVIAFDPRDAGAHAVSMSTVDAERFKLALHGAVAQLDAFFDALARESAD